MDSQNKNKIYAAISISVAVLIAASFFAAVSFLLKISNLVFNVDQNIIKEQTIELNNDGFEMIKNKLNPTPLFSASPLPETSPVPEVSPTPVFSPPY